MKKSVRPLSVFLLFALCFLTVASAPIALYNRAEALEAEDASRIRGIDVSQWQGRIDFDRVRKAGIELVYIKSSEGDDFKDPYFERNYREARRVGLKVGFYHFVTARSEEQARRQAYYFASVIRDKNCEGKPAMDFEDLTGLSRNTINEIAVAFLEALQRYVDEEPVVYSDMYNAKRVFDRRVARYPLWIAQYGVRRPSGDTAWRRWAGWQYSDNGRISGITDRVDLDYFTDEMLIGGVSRITVRGDRPTADRRYTIKRYRVRRGDTLTYIAALYHTTVESIRRENNLGNTSRIYAGEVLKIRIDNNQSDKVAFRYITIRRGDTLYALARRYNTTLSHLIRLNRIKNANLIYPGQRLKIARVQTKVKR